jgi:tRNA 2-thiouridine synthesizing protein A
MSSIVDARGLSCPQPVLMALTELKRIQKGEIAVLVDTETSRENVIRAVTAEGWDVRSIDPDGEETYKISITKG